MRADEHVVIVLCCSTYERDAAYVDLLNDLLLASTTSDSLSEGV